MGWWCFINPHICNGNARRKKAAQRHYWARQQTAPESLPQAFLGEFLRFHFTNEEFGRTLKFWRGDLAKGNIGSIARINKSRACHIQHIGEMNLPSAYRSWYNVFDFSNRGCIVTPAVGTVYHTCTKYKENRGKQLGVCHGHVSSIPSSLCRRLLLCRRRVVLCTLIPIISWIMKCLSWTVFDHIDVNEDWVDLKAKYSDLGKLVMEGHLFK